MIRASSQSAALARALALVGQPRDVCPTCGGDVRAPMGGSYLGTHTPNSAALACGIDPQSLYRQLKRMKKGL